MTQVVKLWLLLQLLSGCGRVGFELLPEDAGTPDAQVRSPATD